MKIIQLITGLGMGGAEQSVTSLVDDLADENIEIKLIYFYGEKIVTPRNSKIQIEKVDIKKIFSFFPHLISIVKSFKPDIIHSHMFHANIVARLLKIRFPSIAVINTAHSSNEGGIVRTLLYRSTNWLCDYFTNVSNNAVATFIEKGIASATKLHCVPNGVNTIRFQRATQVGHDIRQELAISLNQTVLLTVGSFREAKDYPTLLNAAELLKKNNVDFKWLIIGGGHQKEMIEQTIIDKNLNENIKLLGFIKNVEHYFNCADFLVVSSKWEGFGLAAAEAMACEKIVISTDCGGVTEVVGGIGFYSPVGDYKQLASNIKSAISLPVLIRNQMGMDARNRVLKEYSTVSVLKRWISIYNMVRNK